MKNSKIKILPLVPSIISLTVSLLPGAITPANASSLNCGSGNNWISNCSSQIYNFFNTVIVSANFGFSPNNLPDFTAILQGNTQILLGNPVDAIIGDPLLGNVGSVDGIADVVQLEVFHNISSGTTPFVPLITALAGDGVPDLAPTPPGSTLPYVSLYSAGAISQRNDNPSLGDSFLKFFLEIQGTPEGTIRTRDPVTLNVSSPLIGFPPEGAGSQLEFFSSAITPLFTPGPDGVFWTGDEVEVARIVPDANNRAVTLSLTPIPEPSNTLSCLLLGLGLLGVSCLEKAGKKFQ